MVPWYPKLALQIRVLLFKVFVVNVFQTKNVREFWIFERLENTDLTGSRKRDVVVSLDRRKSAQLDIEKEEDEAVERWTQAVTQASDAGDHSLH